MRIELAADGHDEPNRYGMPLVRHVRTDFEIWEPDVALSIDLTLTGTSSRLRLRAGLSTIIVGANGSGKTRLARHCEKELGAAAHRISAQRLLALDPSIQKISEKAARGQLRYGYARPEEYSNVQTARDVNRWSEADPSFILNDAGALLQVLFAEQANVGVAVNDAAQAGGPAVGRETLVIKLKEIFHRVLPTRRLITTADDVQVTALTDGGESEPYSLTRMSDGEKAVFYIIGQILVAEAGSVFIMDEPEIHVHRSILGRLWDELEAARPDCAVLLITHDLEFAASRTGMKYVVRSYLPEAGWTIEEVPEAEGFSEELVTLILGSRRPVLFVEGRQGSLDLAFYRACYPEWTIVPRGGCDDVIRSVATMRANASLTRITCAGLVDADARDEADRTRLAARGIAVLPVAEIENLLLLPDISRVILEKNDYGGNELEAKLAEIEDAVVAEASHPSNVNVVVLGYCRRRIDRALKTVDLSAEKTIPDLAASYAAKTEQVDIVAIATEIRTKIEEAITARDLRRLLAVYDRKEPLLAIASRLRTGHVREFSAWVTRAMGSREDDRLRNAIRAYLPLVTAA